MCKSTGLGVKGLKSFLIIVFDASFNKRVLVYTVGH